jgi:hypothetical protein
MLTVVVSAAASVPPTVINPDKVFQDYHTAQGRFFGRAFLFPILVKGITLKDPRLFILLA